MKEIKWNTKARDFVRLLEVQTKREIGTLLMMLQAGQKLSAPQTKPMKIIHQNAYELRVKDRNGNYRIIYVLNFGDKILMPHAFYKKSQKTQKRDIELSIKRLKELMNEEVI